MSKSAQHIASQIIAKGYAITLDIERGQCLCSVWGEIKKDGMEPMVVNAIGPTMADALGQCYSQLPQQNKKAA
ncbi:MAG: hypothetical protein SV201_05860 [Pseudomonadota bacterium]|nr:hypothetical protein [Pseudomonadota bacterium]